MFFRDVLCMYDKRSTALKTDTPSPGADVTIEVREVHEALAGRPQRLPGIKAQRQLHCAHLCAISLVSTCA